MKDYIIVVFIFCIVCLIACFAEEHNKVYKYQQYYKHTEALLDSLEEHFNWQDRYDDEVVDKYYDNRSNI